MANLTPNDIDDKLTSLGSALAAAEAEVDGFSLGAVSGDPAAVEKLTKAHGLIVQLTTERGILIRARTAAEAKLHQLSEAEAEAKRNAAKERAEGLAARLLEMAQRADAIAEEYRSMAHTIPDIEMELWAALRAAGADISDGIIGRRGLANHVASSIACAPAPIRPRCAAEVAAAAWGFLLAGKDI